MHGIFFHDFSLIKKRLDPFDLALSELHWYFCVSPPYWNNNLINNSQFFMLWLSNFSLCKKNGLYGFCPYDFYLFLQEITIKLCLDFNFPLLLVAIIFKSFLTLSKGKIVIIRVFDICIQFLLQFKTLY